MKLPRWFKHPDFEYHVLIATAVALMIISFVVNVLGIGQ